MSVWKFYHNPNCSKSREALALLNDQGADFTTIEYLKNPLSEKNMQELVAQLKGPISSLVRTKETDFTIDPFDTSSADVVALQLSRKPHLMERPVLQGKGIAVVGRPLENIEELLKK